jgi:hypothetical protein
MRIWDIQPTYLCRKHLLAEHRELHGLWNILTIHKAKGGYSKHPETLRWVGKTKALYNRHQSLVKEFEKRGYRHMTPLEKGLNKSTFANTMKTSDKQNVFINTRKEQKQILKNKNCDCFQ